MSDPTPVQGSVQTPAAPAESGWRRFRRSGWVLVGAALLTGLIGYGVGRASGARWHGHGYGMHQFGGDASMRRAERGIDRMLSRIDGTAEQKAKLTEIARLAIRDLQPMREQLRGGREKLAAVLRTDKVDRAAIEQLRADQLALGETASKRASQAIADAAEVLTPGQRAALVERWQRRSWRG
jgi:periplasmic protein CpxP/Spy